MGNLLFIEHFPSFKIGQSFSGASVWYDQYRRLFSSVYKAYPIVNAGSIFLIVASILIHKLLSSSLENLLPFPMRERRND